MFPSAEEASETQFADGAVVTVQLCATHGSEVKQQQMMTATIQNAQPVAMAVCAGRRSEVLQIGNVVRFIAITPAIGPAIFLQGLLLI